MNIKSTNGFTLVEIMISILILSVGIFGITALHMRSLDGNRNALLRVQAGQLVSDLTERIQVNVGTAYGPISLGDVPADPTDCTTSNCTPTQLAEYDTSQWLCSVNSLASDGTTHPACANLSITGILPMGQASIAVVGDEYDIKINWSDLKSNQTRTVELFIQVPE